MIVGYSAYSHLSQAEGTYHHGHTYDITTSLGCTLDTHQSSNSAGNPLRVFVKSTVELRTFRRDCTVRVSSEGRGRIATDITVLLDNRKQ